MTRDELSQLTFDQLVDLILHLQAEAARLQVRIAELEMHGPVTSTAPAVPSATPEIRWNSAAAGAPEPQGPVLTTQAIEDHVHVRRSRHHRPWYKKLWRAVRPQNARLSITVIATTIVVIALSVAIVFWLPQLRLTDLIRTR
ncbi:MAG: hypothetical protein HZB53_14385 [Chloroflexi bacterium]|nr:hypothetical protein [Chloroflexota bacterium]